MSDKYEYVSVRLVVEPDEKIVIRKDGNADRETLIEQAAKRSHASSTADMMAGDIRPLKEGDVVSVEEVESGDDDA